MARIAILHVSCATGQHSYLLRSQTGNVYLLFTWYEYLANSIILQAHSRKIVRSFHPNLSKFLAVDKRLHVWWSRTTVLLVKRAVFMASLYLVRRPLFYNWQMPLHLYWQVMRKRGDTNCERGGQLLTSYVTQTHTHTHFCFPDFIFLLFSSPPPGNKELFSEQEEEEREGEENNFEFPLRVDPTPRFPTFFKGNIAV